MIGQKANAEMLILARESRGWTQAELAHAANLAQPEVSRYEGGISAVPEDRLQKIADALGYPKTFFYWRDARQGCGSSCVYSRKRQSLSVRDLRRLTAAINLFRMRLCKLLQSVETEKEIRFYKLDLADFDNSPEQAARRVRALWNVPNGPIANLTTTIERAGGVVFRYPFETRKLDALSHWADDAPPVFFVNADIPGDRLRLTLAHEIGHVVLHHVPTPGDREDEANEFAAELLMPSREIGPSLRALSLEKLAALKQYWKVSMAALVVRAHRLGRITEIQYRRLFTQMSMRGYRLEEPFPIPIEHSTVFREAVNLHLHSKELNYNLTELSTLVGLKEDEFTELYLSEGARLRIVK